MSRHHWHRTRWLLLLLVFALIADHAQAQSIAPNWKSAADCEPFRQKIAAAVDSKILKLQSTDPETQKFARTWLAEQVAGAQPSASFMDVYGDVVGNALKNIVDPKNAAKGKPASIRVRLNAAIVNAQIAQRTGNDRQSAVTNILLHDPCEAVVLWGMKAAKFELYVQIGHSPVMRKPDLIPSILQAAKAHPDSGAISDEAFRALSLKDTDDSLKNATDAMIRELIPAILDLASFRISLFGDASPPDLSADGNFGASFLVRTHVWDLESPSDQQKVLDTMYGYLAGSTKLLVANPPPDNKDELLGFTRQVGRTFEAVAEVKSDPVLKKAAEFIVSIVSDSTSDDIDKRLNELKAAIDGAHASAP